MNRSERIGTLLFQYVRNELSPGEGRELAEWRKESAENDALFVRKTNRDNILMDLGRWLDAKERSFQKIKEQHPEIWKKPVVEGRARIYRITRIAAIFIVALGAGLYFLGGNAIHAGGYRADLISTDGIITSLSDFQRGFLAGSAGIIIEKTESGALIYHAPNDFKKSKDKLSTLRTDKGGEFMLKLPDNTLIWLNAASSIKYPANFNQDSIYIFLEGEAYFEIPKNSAHHYFIIMGMKSGAERQSQNAERPWTIDAQQGGLKPTYIQVDPGVSQLNLKAYAEDSVIQTTIIGGSATIHMDSTGTHQIYNLQQKAGQQTQWKKGEFTGIPLADTSATIAWKNRRTTFRGADLQTIMQTVSRWYNVEVIYFGEAPVGKFNIDVSRDADLSEIINSLKQQGVHIMISGKKVTVIK